MKFLACATVVALAASPAFSQEKVDYASVQKIRDEALGNNSQVMETIRQLTDVIGPRLTGSPNLKAANEWTRKQLEDWGLANAHLESWGPFGRGWSYEKASVTMLAPQGAAFIAVPKAWTPGTNGPQRGKVVRAGRLESQEDLDKWKGKLEGAILIIGDARELKAPDANLFQRFDADGLEKLSRFEIPRRPGTPPPGAPAGGPAADPQAFMRRFAFQKTLREFLAKEKVLATIEGSGLDAGMLRSGGGGSREKGEETGPLALVLAAEHFNRIARLMDKKIDVELEIDVKARFHDDDLMAYNTIAEIPGTDPIKKNEVVMVGAHLDSWHLATGATDNAAGSGVAMEIMRILKDMKPKRTIRIGLWTGEEQGLLGSRAYVSEHFGGRPAPPAGAPRLPGGGGPQGPITLKPDQAKLSAYFNLDNGTGKVRGVYLQQNAAAAPIFEAWIKPFGDLGVTTLSMRNTGGTDHLSFDAVGIPGFQMIQDEADYDTRTHHTNLDTYDRIQRDDMMQASAVMASFVLHAANRDEMFPRKSLPKDTIMAPAATPSPAPKKK